MLLNHEQRNTLYVLGYLYLRMGFNEAAERLFSMLLALYPDDKWVHKNLAVIAMRKKDGMLCLNHIYKSIEGEKNIEEHAPMLILQAQALWQLGRKIEARTSIKNYIQILGR